MLNKKIGRHHIAFYRGWLQGLDLGELGDRYLETGIDLRRAKSTLKWLEGEIRQAAIRHGKIGMARLLRLSIKAAVAPAQDEVPSLESFRENVDPDGFFTEKELIEVYASQHPKAAARAGRRQMMIEKQLRALAWIETLLVTDPHPDDLVSAWFDSTVANRLILADIPDLKTLKEVISARGYRWWVGVPRLGEKGAAAIVRWLQEHAATLGEVPVHAMRPLRTIPREVLDAQRPPSTGIVPIGSLALSPALDGAAGINRHPGRPMIDATNDLQAVQSWLAMKAPGENTRQAYLKEAERLVLWAVMERQKALSDLSVDDCGAYRDWLGLVGRADPESWPYRLPQSAWVMTGGRAGRHSDGWKPIRQPLSAKSIKHAIGILSGMFNWLARVQYLASNPWVAVSTTIVTGETDAPDLELTRALTKWEWEYLLRHVDGWPYSPATERARFIIRFGYLTGMRRAEMAAATAGRLYVMALSDGGVRWMLKVEGKGSKWRAVPIVPELLAALSRYLEARGLAPVPSDNHPDTPLIAGLDGRALTGNMIYRILRDTFASASSSLRAEGREMEARHFDRASTHWLRHTRGSHLGLDGAKPTLIQKLLGHASIATTSIYTKADDEALWSALAGADRQ